MLKVLAFYLFYWWFVKLENRKVIIVRAALASILAILFLMGAITVFTEPHIVADGFAFVGIFSLIPALLFVVRAFFDIKNLIKK